ncbi:hypothetical protein S40285_07966, partial [Stachybotrys chlorohalonatus IBT 40285]
MPTSRYLKMDLAVPRLNRWNVCLCQRHVSGAHAVHRGAARARSFAAYETARRAHVSATDYTRLTVAADDKPTTCRARPDSGRAAPKPAAAARVPASAGPGASTKIASRRRPRQPRRVPSRRTPRARDLRLETAAPRPATAAQRNTVALSYVD